MAFSVTCYCNEYRHDNLGGCIVTGHDKFDKKDTVRVNNTLYYNGTSSWDAFWKHYIREDTLTGQLFRYNPYNQKEYLLCDMSLNVGDTFKIFEEHPWLGSLGTDYMELEDFNGDYYVDSVYYANGLKILELHRIGEASYLLGMEYGGKSRFNISIRFMESIGPMYGLGAIQRSKEHYMPTLLCVHKDDTLYYMTHEDLQCEQNAAGITIYDDAIMSIYPNPASNKITVSFENGTAENGNLYLTDIMGRILWQGKVTDNLQTISIHGYAPGLYTVLYMDSQGKTAKKVLVQ